MAAPLKKGLDYFPLDVEIFDEDKIALVSEEFGIMAELIVVKLLCRIYKDQGYYALWNDDIASLMAKRDFCCSVKGAFINKVVQALVDRQFFDKKLFDTFHILTSKGIQSRYKFAKRLSRSPQLIESKFNLLPREKSEKKGVKNDVNVNNVLKERKEKEMKENEIKEKKNIKKEKNINSSSDEEESPFPSETDAQYGAVDRNFSLNNRIVPIHSSNMDYQSILDSYNRICGEKLPQVAVLSDPRKKQIRTREPILRKLGKSWDDFFRQVVNSDFLTGDNQHGFQATFDWIIKPSNFAKIMNGNYDNRSSRKKNNSGPIEIDYNRHYSLEESFKKF